jgi:hypothetical protein
LFRQYRPAAKSDHELTPHQVRLLKSRHGHAKLRSYHE